jgi:hypothetical protein
LTGGGWEDRSLRRRLGLVGFRFALLVVASLFAVRHGFSPSDIRSDQGPEFIAEAVKSWISAVGAQTACAVFAPVRGTQFQ